MEEENQNLDDIVSYNQGGFDISLPDIPLPPTIEIVKEKSKDECEVSFKFAFVGAGQGGSRIAESFHRLGYRKIAAINTAQQDLNTISVPDKLCIGEGGAGKNPDVAQKLYAERKEDVLDFLRDSFGETFDRVFICAGAGGGSGAGTVSPLVDSALELQKMVKCKSQKIGVILALPMISEGSKVNSNAFQTLSKVWKLLEEGKVSPLILLDNEKINRLYPNLAVGPFWQTANSSITGLFHLFNLTSARDSSYSAFDSNDYLQILDSGLIVFGASPVKEWQEASSLSKAIRDNLNHNMLSGGLDLSTGNSAGAIIIGGKEILDNLPQANLDRAFDQFTRTLRPNSIVHRGIYSGDKPTLTVYTVLGGLGRPTQKLAELEKLSH